MTATNNEEHLSERTFEHTWTIKNWKQVVHNDNLLENTTTEIQLEEENVVYAKVLIGTSIFRKTAAGFYWKLLWRQHRLDNLQVDMVTDFLQKGGAFWTSYETQGNAVIGTIIPIVESFWSRSNQDSVYAKFCNSDGSLVMNLKVTLKNFLDIAYMSRQEELMGIFKNEITRNFAALLRDNSNSDVKILTKDKIEVSAHKTILRAQCPVFVSMIGSDFLENSTGLVNVDDISSKTMKILLNFWYTGELLPSWKDDDTILEFTYAAGKYQMTSVLKMLDELLGAKINVSEKNTELLKMVQNLTLKNAEARILKQIVSKVNQAVSGNELLDMFNIETDKLDEKSFEVSQVVKACNDALDSNDDKLASCEDVKFMALACKLGMKNVESKLLKRIISTVAKVTSANELFALFDIKIEEGRQVSEDSAPVDMLVRAEPK